eukprot:423969-Amorphochlora_amoeboformis.AAC.1
MTAPSNASAHTDISQVGEEETAYERFRKSKERERGEGLRREVVPFVSGVRVTCFRVRPVPLRWR